MYWKLLFGFTIFVTIGMLVMMISMPQAGGDIIPTSIIFTFPALFYGLELLGVFDVPNYGMGGIAMIITAPVGLLWVFCGMMLLLFGPGKTKATYSSGYRTFRKIALTVGSLFCILTVLMTVVEFLRAL